MDVEEVAIIIGLISIALSIKNIINVNNIIKERKNAQRTLRNRSKRSVRNDF